MDATLPEHKEAKRDALTPEQLQRVLDFTDRTDIYDLYVMHCAIQLAFACCMRGGEVGGTQWERFSRSDQVLYIDRVIDRVDKKLIEKLPKMVLKIGVFVNYAIGLIAYLTTGAFAVHIIKPSVKALLGNSVMSADLYKMENA